MFHSNIATEIRGRKKFSDIRSAGKGTIKRKGGSLTWMSSDVKCPFMSLFFFLGGGGAGLWAGGRSVLLREQKDNMTLSTEGDRHSLCPSPSTALYNEKSCLHLPFSTLSSDFDRSCVGGFVAAEPAFPPALSKALAGETLC